METGVPKRLLGAFVIGGVIGLVSELFFVFWRMVFGEGSMWSMPAVLVTLGVAAGVLYVLGVYQKIEKVAYMGAVLPFSGLVSAVAGSYLAGEKQGGSKRGIVKGVEFFLYVLGIGALLSGATAVVVFLVG